MDLEKELKKWRHFHFDGRRDGDHNGEWLDRVSQQDLANFFYDLAKKDMKEDIELREERIDELVRSLKDLKEAYEELVAERERMLKNAFKAHKINYPDGTFIFRTKSIISDDMEERGFERGDELKFVIVKTPLAKIIKH